MIDFQLLSALVTYYFIMFATPGPNNAMLTASGLKFGFVKTLPHLIGIPLGHIFQIGLVCFGFGNLFVLFPELPNHINEHGKSIRLKGINKKKALSERALKALANWLDGN